MIWYTGSDFHGGLQSAREGKGDRRWGGGGSCSYGSVVAEGLPNADHSTYC